MLLHRGPGDTNLLPRILHRAKHNQLRMINGGTKLMDAVYIDNAVHAHILAVDQLRAQVSRGASLRAAALRSAQGTQLTAVL
jgi:nucleoside-diphosphate-sugar epimerase